MIVLESIKEKQEAAKDLLQNPNFSKFMVLDGGHLKFQDDKDKFKFALEILNTINFMIMVNEVLKNTGYNKEVDISILYQAMDHVLKEKAFKDPQLEQYFKFWQEFETVSNLLLKLYNTDEFYLDYQIDFILFGCTIKDFENSKGIDWPEIHQNYGDLNCEVRFKDLNIENFIEKAKEILTPNAEGKKGKLSA